LDLGVRTYSKRKKQKKDKKRKKDACVLPKIPQGFWYASGGFFSFLKGIDNAPQSAYTPFRKVHP